MTYIVMPSFVYFVYAIHCDFDLQADMDQINQKMERLETALQISQDQCKSLKVENATLRAQMQKLGSLSYENSELHTEVSTLQEAVKKIERERDEVKSTLQAAEAQVCVITSACGISFD